MKSLTLFLLMLTACCRAVDVHLEWDAADPAASVTEYRIYEKTAAGYVRVGTTTALTFSVTNVTPGVHTYVATASNSFEEGGYSNEVVATVPAPLAPPKNLRRKQLATQPRQ